MYKNIWGQNLYLRLPKISEKEKTNKCLQNSNITEGYYCFLFFKPDKITQISMSCGLFLVNTHYWHYCQTCRMFSGTVWLAALLFIWQLVYSVFTEGMAPKKITLYKAEETNCGKKPIYLGHKKCEKWEWLK